MTEKSILIVSLPPYNDRDSKYEPNEFPSTIEYVVLKGELNEAELVLLNAVNVPPFNEEGPGIVPNASCAAYLLEALRQKVVWLDKDLTEGRPTLRTKTFSGVELSHESTITQYWSDMPPHDYYLFGLWASEEEDSGVDMYQMLRSVIHHWRQSVCKQLPANASAHVKLLGDLVARLQLLPNHLRVSFGPPPIETKGQKSK